MEKIKNYIYIDGEYVDMDELPDKQKAEVSEKILVRFAEKMGYKKDELEAVEEI